MDDRLVAAQERQVRFPVGGGLRGDRGRTGVGRGGVRGHRGVAHACRFLAECVTHLGLVHEEDDGDREGHEDVVGRRVVPGDELHREDDDRGDHAQEPTARVHPEESDAGHEGRHADGRLPHRHDAAEEREAAPQ